ncbi:hypothetical protein METBIDRAFT_195093 [Metschnikowia bicuspidata var. bicuspidata NRRL YB-4993]|uniref:Uncharacterized protein n=1 Tax=Metschnikowia bicuspidata var. bicuspidata NRRL YB-4993 TaxID=869754 RepID=A0A1A0H8C4_9ASCO|nr:hypothetical protein METBIDRAFT_195093 [Metschnikowia bicuspidata var. bicuspidata NRRL YB-4993]OBA20276.1 hypothetical protein METBIDRAFT_195093 [Metschnikowia bicuspidata var. bicuspidata NRRL YB-4993]
MDKYRGEICHPSQFSFLLKKHRIISCLWRDARPPQTKKYKEKTHDRSQHWLRWKARAPIHEISQRRCDSLKKTSAHNQYKTLNKTTKCYCPMRHVFLLSFGPGPVDLFSLILAQVWTAVLCWRHPRFETQGNPLSAKVVLIILRLFRNTSQLFIVLPQPHEQSPNFSQKHYLCFIHQKQENETFGAL